MKGYKAISFILVFVALSFQGVQAKDMIASAKSLKEKLKEVSMVIKREPANGRAYAERADLKFELQDMYGAIKDYSTAIQLSSETNPEYLEGRGRAFLEIGAFKEAFKDFDQALGVVSSTDLLYGRAVASYFLDDFFGSLRDLDQVIAAAPSHSKALYNRAIVKMELKQLEAAAIDLDNFLAHYPGHQEAERAMAAADAVLQKHRPAR